MRKTALRRISLLPRIAAGIILTCLLATHVAAAAPPTVSMSFGAAMIPVGGSTSLTFTIGTANPLTNASLVDNLPSGLAVAPITVVNDSCTGGTLTASGSVISLIGFTLAGPGVCSLSLDIIGTAPGLITNTVTVVDAVAGADSATATIVVGDPPTISKSFAQPVIAVGGTTTLSFTITNVLTAPVGGISFQDLLPAGLLIAAPNGLTGSCGGGAITAAAGTNNIRLAGGSLAANASCTFSVNVTAVAAGVQNNVTTPVNAATYGNGNSAIATVKVTGSPAPGRFSAPSGIVATILGTIMVVDTGNNRVEVFDQSFNFKFAFGTSGPGKLNQPTSITVLGLNTILVTDTGNNRVVIFDLNGNFHGSFGE